MTQDNQPNSHIEDYLDYYCELPQAPEFAVLLKGQWGSGKTWFIDKYREKLAKDQQKSLYVSLYGVTSFAEIEDQFFQQLHPVLSSKGMAITGKIFKGLLKGALKIDLNNDGKEEGAWNIQTPEIDLTKYFKDADRSILIFDDLERCKIDLGNILGYINSFVEHQGLKVIIIANEEELLKMDRDHSPSGYKTIKEKLIGKTFEVSPDLHGSLENFIEKVQEPELKEFLSINAQVIEDVYKRAEYENLRSLKQIILDFERIFKELPEKAGKKPEFLKDLLKSLMAFSIEIKRGKMFSEHIKNFKEGLISARIEQSQLAVNLQSSTLTDGVRSLYEDMHRRNAEIIELQEKISNYTGLYGYELLFPSDVWWQTFFDKGIIDIEEFERLLPNSKYFQDESRPNWVKLWNFQNFRDDQLNDLIEQVELDYADKKISDIGVIKHTIGILLNLSYSKLYLKSQEQILIESKNYIDQLKASGQLDLSNSTQCDSSPLDETGHNGLEFQGRELKEFKEFCDYITHITESAKAENLPIFFKELLDRIQSDIGKFCEMLSGSYFDINDEEYCDSILRYIEPCAFIDRVLPIKFEDQKHIFQALSRRYQFGHNNEKLLQESEWLKSVQKLLLKEANHKKGKTSGYNLERLNEHYLNKVIEDLEKIEAQINKYHTE
jgi:KAP family P-loop domain